MDGWEFSNRDSYLHRGELSECAGIGPETRLQRAANLLGQPKDVAGRLGSDSGRGRAGVSGAPGGIAARAAGDSCELPDQSGVGAADAADAVDPGVPR